VPAKLIIRVCLFAAAAVTSACALTPGEKEFSCGHPNGKRCVSVRDAYHGVNRGGSDAGDATLATRPVNHPDRWPNAPWVNMPTIDSPQPVRAPPKVMRIWLASWEDREGDLIVPAYVYTEIEPRTWLIGDPEVQSTGRLLPLDLTPRTPSSPSGN
jgi:conjugal transfer pilus assembly protein TraV